MKFGEGVVRRALAVECGTRLCNVNKHYMGSSQKCRQYYAQSLRLQLQSKHTSRLDIIFHEKVCSSTQDVNSQLVTVKELTKGELSLIL